MTTADLCVYGGTPAGCVAAVAAAREGASVVLIEPSRWLGGMFSAGIKPLQDCPLPEAVGGLTGSELFGLGEDPLTFLHAVHRWVVEAGVTVLFERRVRRVRMDGTRIAGLDLETSSPDAWGVPLPASRSEPAGQVTALCFIDASYEGDLMAAAGVPYRTGREARSEFDEAPAGVQEPTNWTPIDPYREPGRPESGLLPGIDPDHGLPRGAGDSYTQAYNYRYYVTADPARREPITPPEDLRPERFELLRRYVRQLAAGEPDRETLLARLRSIFPGWINSGEYNYERGSLISIAPLGLSKDYADGDWDTRSAIWREHIEHLRGLHHVLSTSGEVPVEIRAETAALGLDRAVYPHTQGWPHQLYVRVTRRLSGRYILTHRDVQNRTTIDDSIGLALFGVDVYPVRRIARTHPETGAMGVATEGDMFIGGHLGTGTPYPVPYRAITPERSDCTNLLVPVCLSATHIAYAATRMEPVFSVLGESAAVAALMALEGASAVQDIDTHELQRRLVARGQRL
ncbi:FAD-dependent oxidoreductase [Leifsonia sp. 21MFCrub1.1]|uniref:FAD-dependent oxidoreductase n=1 Tax=Leifsonia sp. 21MFCrub1.1 TaxID=1798223 RepID=UPI00089281AF|nr:FAD-dependent oxidoreductase [Leifsonia sp. 21MFCrub1.1]SEB09890.1 FAD dependent oxidoreductase [Leifsonia sp. 21MFCrub1.1]